MAENKLNTAEESRNPHVRHEPGDVNAVSVTKFGIAMALLILVFLFVLTGLFRFLAKRAAEVEAPTPTIGARLQKLPPEPRLGPDPSLDLTQMRAEEDRILHQYAWLDPDKGIVRIPVDRAMDLVLQKGLLTAAAQPGTPPPAAAGKTP
jgi:hypothetical protein